MIIKAALLLFREHNGQKELLFAKPRGKSYYVFPGGKQESNETIEEALQRELEEELGVRAVSVSKLGAVKGHTPDGRTLEMHLYVGELVGEPHAQAEIESIAWISRDEALKQSGIMTPMTLDHIMPFLSEQKMW